MKPISEWTDAEIDTVKLFGKDGIEHFAAEVLRLRASLDLEVGQLVRANRLIQVRAEKAEREKEAAEGALRIVTASRDADMAELARCRPVVDAALAYRDVMWDFRRTVRQEDATIERVKVAVDAYRAGENQ